MKQLECTVLYEYDIRSDVLFLNLYRISPALHAHSCADQPPDHLKHLAG